jgi:hypothetical protein
LSVCSVILFDCEVGRSKLGRGSEDGGGPGWRVRATGKRVRREGLFLRAAKEKAFARITRRENDEEL